jgi:hypothetical protein
MRLGVKVFLIIFILNMLKAAEDDGHDHGENGTCKAGTDEYCQNVKMTNAHYVMQVSTKKEPLRKWRRN